MVLRFVLTVIITLGIVYAALTVPPANGLFWPFREKLSDLPLSLPQIIIPQDRNLSFLLAAERYEMETTQAVNNISVELHASDLFLSFGDSTIEGEKYVIIKGFYGGFSLSDNLVILTGESDRLEMPEEEIAFNEKEFQLTAEFSGLRIENLEIGRLELKNVTGSLEVRDLNISLDSQNLIIDNMKASVLFGRELLLAGTSSMISIPQSDIIIK